MYSGMTATKPAIMRVVTRNGTDGTAITSSASISSRDPHRTELRGETTADGGRQRERRDERRESHGC